MNAPENVPLRTLRESIEASVLNHARIQDVASTTPDESLRLLEACAAAALICEQLQGEAVQHARRADHSWAAIGGLLGISRQAAQQRFSGDKADAGANAATRTIVATLGNEMQLLKTEGEKGNHLVDFGLYYLQVQASRHVWEHRREIALNIRDKRNKLEAEGWIYVGAMLPFHYFKRQVS